MSTENIPRSDAAFNEKCKTVTAYIKVNLIRFKLDPAFFGGVCQPAFELWTEKYEAYLPIESRTPVIVAEKNNARNEFMPLFRQLISGLLCNPNVTDNDLAAMDLRRPTNTRTPVPVPVSWPVVLVDINTPRIVTLNFSDSASLKKAKPKGVSGAVIRYALLETPPTDINELGNMLFDTQTPCSIEFSESQRGQKLYFCLVWQNTRGQNGPWGTIGMAMVP